MICHLIWCALANLAKDFLMYKIFSNNLLTNICVWKQVNTTTSISIVICNGMHFDILGWQKILPKKIIASLKMKEITYLIRKKILRCIHVNLARGSRVSNLRHLFSLLSWSKSHTGSFLANERVVFLKQKSN